MFWNNFNKICIEKNIKPNPVAKEIGVSSATVTNWKNGAIPNGETLIKLANYLNVSIDYLLGRTTEQAQQIITNNGGEIGKAVQAQTYNSSSELNGLQKEMIEAMEQLPKSKQLEALQEVYKILEENK